MAGDDRLRWDRQHAERAGSDVPADFLAQVIDGGAWDIARGAALDLACGKGRNALYLAARGFKVDAVDISPVALQEARRRAEASRLTVHWQEADLENTPVPGSSYELIVNFNYLQRSLFPIIKASLAPGGCVVFETYLIEQQRVGHPRNPDHLLGHNELLRVFGEFRILWYREGRFADSGDIAFRAGILAQKHG